MKRTGIITIIILFLFVGIANAQTEIKQIIEEGSFSSITIRTSIPVSVTKGDENSISIIGNFDKDEIGDISGISTIKDKNLTIMPMSTKLESKEFQERTNARIELKIADRVDHYSLSGSAQLNIYLEELNEYYLSIYLSDWSHLNIEKLSNVNHLNITASDNSTVSIICLEKVVEKEIMLMQNAELIKNKSDIRVNLWEGRPANYPYGVADKHAMLSVIANFGFGSMGWSPDHSSNIFSSPVGPYSVSAVRGSSWTMGVSANFRIYKRLGGVLGIGYESDVFKFREWVKLDKDGDYHKIVPETDGSLSKLSSKLVARYIRVPVFLTYKLSSSLAAHGGVITNFNFNTSHTGFKRDYTQGNDKIKERSGEKFAGFRPIRLDAQVGLTYSYITLYLRYAVTPIFRDEMNMTLYPYSFGLSLGI